MALLARKLPSFPLAATMAEDDAKPAAAAAAAADDDDSDVEMSGEYEDESVRTRRRMRHVLCPVSFARWALHQNLWTVWDEGQPASK